MYVCTPSHCFPSKPLLPYDLVHTYCDVRQGIQAHLMRVVAYIIHFVLNKFNSQSITFDEMLYPWLHSNMLSTLKPNPCMKFSHSHVSTFNCDIFISKVLEHWESIVTFTCILWKSYPSIYVSISQVIFYLWRWYIIKSICLLISLSISQGARGNFLCILSSITCPPWTYRLMICCPFYLSLFSSNYLSTPTNFITIVSY